MRPTLEVGDFVMADMRIHGGTWPLIKRPLPGVRDPQYGDLIVFQYPRDPVKMFVKRCIAVGGQIVEVRDKQVLVDGEPLDEPYIQHVDSRIIDGRDSFGPVEIPAGHYFVMGDNRDNSSDSRVWGFLPRDLVVARLMRVYWSWKLPDKKIRWHRIGRVLE